MPLPNTRVIPTLWSDHHRPTAEGGMTATCVVTRRDPVGTTDAAGRWTPTTPTTLYTGPVRVLALTPRRGVLVVGDAQETVRRYQVSLRFDVPEIRIGDLVAVTGSVDSGLFGKQLRVADVALGSEEWQRDLICDEVVT